MASKPIRVVVLAILFATLLTVATPVAAQARMHDQDTSFSVHVQRVVQHAGSSLSSLWDGLLGFMAASTAAICGDG